MGGQYSGVSFHYHGAGFSEAIIGRKRWFLFPPHLTQVVMLFNPNMTVNQWVNTIYPRIKQYQYKIKSMVDKNGDDQHHDVCESNGDDNCDINTLYHDNYSHDKRDNIDDIPSNSSASNNDDNYHISNSLINNINHYLHNSNNTIQDNNIDISLTTEHLRLLADHLYECELNANEVLYFPSMWMHATLNIDDYNVFMSVFIDTQLIK